MGICLVKILALNTPEESLQIRLFSKHLIWTEEVSLWVYF
jgi:hypothetical protein